MINIKVTKYDIEPRSIYCGTQGSEGVETLSFAFSSEWGGLIKSITFFPPRATEQYFGINSDGTFEIPASISSVGGDIDFVVTGSDGDKVLYTLRGVAHFDSTEQVTGEALAGNEYDFIKEMAKVVKNATEEGVNAVNESIKSSVTSVKIFGAVGDGVTDDTVAIQNALDFGGTVYIPNGIYMINGACPDDNTSDIVDCGLVIKSNSRLIMDKGAILKLIPCGTKKSCVLRCEYSATDIEIVGGQIHGDRNEHVPNDLDYPGEHGMGIWLCGNENVKISGCIIKDCWGDGILVTLNRNFDLPSRNVLVDNVVIDNCRRNGISLVGVVGFTISDSTIKNTNGTNPQSAIDIEPSPYTWNSNENILIAKCKITDNANYGVVTMTTDKIYSKNATIADCIFENNLRAVQATIDGFVITNSTVRGSESIGVSLSKCSEFSVSNCNFSENGDAGLQLYGECSGVVDNCKCNNNGADGIVGMDIIGSDIVIRACTVNRNKGRGIRLYVNGGVAQEERESILSASKPIIISECIAKENADKGIYGLYIPRVYVDKCVCVNNGSSGVFIHRYCDESKVTNCFLEGNFISNASGYDMGCYGNDNSKIIGNTFRMGATEHTNKSLVIGYYNETTTNTFVSENDFRGSAQDIVQIQDTDTIFGKNIKTSGAYE